MTPRQRRLRRIMLGYPLALGGAALIGSRMPGASGGPVTQVAKSGSKFVAPLVSVIGASYVFDSLRYLNPKRKRRKR